MDCKPDEQFLCTVYAGISIGKPAIKAITLAMFGASDDWLTQPMMISSINFGSIFVRLINSLITISPSFCAGKSFNAPPRFPRGVLIPSTITTSLRLVVIIFLLYYDSLLKILSFNHPLVNDKTKKLTRFVDLLSAIFRSGQH